MLELLGKKLSEHVKRPWGSYLVIEEGEAFKVKLINVHPECMLSLQSHKFRSEHWVVVRGEAEVVNGETRSLIRQNESIFIPVGNKHRLSNPSKTETLVVVEVQVGSYLEEDDITRYEDIYNRV